VCWSKGGRERIKEVEERRRDRKEKNGERKKGKEETE
jgi:hypothetical protein